MIDLLTVLQPFMVDHQRVQDADGIRIDDDTWAWYLAHIDRDYEYAALFMVRAGIQRYYLAYINTAFQTNCTHISAESDREALSKFLDAIDLTPLFKESQ